MEYLDTYHPYWSGKLAAEYDNRAGKIGALLVSKNSTQAPEAPDSASRFHERLLSEEYGLMSREEFTLRITLARTANTLRKRWFGGNRYLMDSSLSSKLDADWCEPLASREPVYIHLGVSAAPHVTDDVLLDGFYIERLSPEGEADVFGMGLVFQKATTIDCARSLGDLLVRQSILSYGLLDSLESDANVDLIVKDPAVDDAMFAAALDATHHLNLSINAVSRERHATRKNTFG